MVHKLAIVAITGLTISAVCLGAGAALEAESGGKGFGDGLNISMFNDKPRCETVAGATATSRDLDWDGSDHVGLAVGGHATYTPGTDNRIHVTGDPQALAHLQVRDGTIEMNCNSGFFHNLTSNLQITLPGQPFRKFAIAGSTDLELHNLSQDMLTVSIAGSGDVKADGKVEHVQIHIAGSGDANLGQVNSRVAEVNIAGSGDTDIAPTDEADVHIAGSGDVTLHSSPKHLEQHVAGSGRVHVLGNGSI